ncbi:MAG: single-stranded-DNA-specific exonuclease RecJ [Chroococcidiopsidaceae cyanobacterium CP_BM_ER_R8_30]|nr:single-stranded-DNA-specific exonuclease RecJ [Chroococcidiopsidaceae cyanobacterium CP_BM_ER_R8_30]
MRLPNHRWQIFPAKAEWATQLAQITQLSPIVSQLLVNRGIETLEQAQTFLDPESQVLPSPLEEFPDLAISLELLAEAITSRQKIAICGDYDADGMTSTALLLRAFRWLGADIDYAIPSRMKDGYGINIRIVEEFHREGVQLILTVDNGISALEPIARAKQLGLKVIVTDHHELPQKLPEADAILNPKLISKTSPYYSLAGVGVAYILAVSLAQQLGQAQGIVKPLLELFTLGTIADLAPLTGVNRRWVKRGLRQLPHSELPGIQALIQVAGVRGREVGGQENNPKSLKPEDIGFRLGPRINAVGRIADPQIVIELLTTDDIGLALERAMQCEQINQRRQQLCEQIEREAIAWVEQSQLDLEQERVLVIVQPNWHHGVIGIVASRLVERYGVPVFIGTYEDEHLIRGSARGIPEFHVFEALEFCREILEKFGGHKAAGGFSLLATNLAALRSRLSGFAHQCLEVEHLKPLLKIDAQTNLNQINYQLYTQVDALHPCGIENPDPIFWTPNVQVVEQQIVGKDHLKLTLQDSWVQPFKLSGMHTVLPTTSSCKLKAIAWRWREYLPLPPRIDIAYKLRENIWNGNVTLELELVGVRLPTQRGGEERGNSGASRVGGSPDLSGLAWSPLGIRGQGGGGKGRENLSSSSTCSKATFCYGQRQYICGIFEVDSLLELRIKNSEGKVLAFKLGQTTGLLGSKREEAIEVDLAQPDFCNIVQAALSALGIVKLYSS